MGKEGGRRGGRGVGEGKGRLIHLTHFAWVNLAALLTDQ